MIQMKQMFLISLVMGISSHSFSKPEIEQFTQEGVQNWNCSYLANNPNIISIVDSCGVDAAATKPVCVGGIVCEARLLRTNQLGKNKWLAVCSANANGTCPTAIECVKAASDLTATKGSVMGPKIQSRAEALSEFNASKAHATSSRTSTPHK